MAATVGTTDSTSTVRGMNGYAADLKRFKHDTIRVTGVANSNTLAGGAAGPLPARMVFAAWDPDTATEHCNVVVTATGTVTFYTSGATSYDGYLHVWSVV